MQPTFASASDMEAMVFTSLPKYNIGNAPTKPKQDTGAVELPPILAEKYKEADPAIPDSKDLRKFVRRMPKLRNLKWTGRGGKGEWHFTKKTTLVNVSFTSSILSTLDTWYRCQLDPPFFNYNYEEDPTARTLLEMAPVATVASSPIAEYPSLTRSSTSSSFRIPHTPSSPVASKSFTIKDVNTKLDGMSIMPEDEEFPSLRSKHQRSATMDSVGSSSSVKRTPDLSTSTKRLTIGGGDSRGSMGSARPMALPMLKTVSAPARSNDVASDKVMSPGTGERGTKGKRLSRQT